MAILIRTGSSTVQLLEVRVKSLIAIGVFAKKQWCEFCVYDLDLDFDASMKVAALLACTCAFLSITSRAVHSVVIQPSLHIISLDDLSEEDRKELALLDDHFTRPKRSGSGDLFSILKQKIGEGIKNKLSQIAKASVSSSAHFSGGSSGGHEKHHHHVPEIHDHKALEFLSLKKSILNTLLQAVKAIKGGVIAIKGQLIKGSGYLLSAKGKLISSKGEAITNVGKKIASTAILSPSLQPGHSSHGHDEHLSYGGHGHYEQHHVSAEYGAPSAPGPQYETPHHQHHEDHSYHQPQQHYYQQYQPYLVGYRA